MTNTKYNSAFEFAPFKPYRVAAWRDNGNLSNLLDTPSGPPYVFKPSLIGDDLNLGSGNRIPSALGLSFSDVTDVLGLALDTGPSAGAGEAAGRYAESWKLQYRRIGWPPERGYGAGWETVDDHYHGFWQDADFDVQNGTNVLEFRFRNLSPREIPYYEGESLSFRKTMDIRLVYLGRHAVPAADIRPILPGDWETCRFSLKTGSGGPALSNVRVSGVFAETEESAGPRDNDGLHQMELEVRYLHPRNGIGAAGNRPMLHFRWKDNGFTVNILDLLQYREMQLPDFGLSLILLRSSRSIEADRRSGLGRQIIDLVDEEPEQTLERARREIPRLKPEIQKRYIILGCEANRGEFAVDYDGRIRLNKENLKLRRDDGFIWPAPELSLRVGQGERQLQVLEPGAYRQHLLDAYLPVIVTEWEQDGFEHRLECFTTLLHKDLGDTAEKSGSEPSVLMACWKVRNTAPQPRTVRQWINLQSGEMYQLSAGEYLALGDRTTVVGIPYGRKFHLEPKLRLLLPSTGTSWSENIALSPEAPLGYEDALVRDLTLKSGEGSSQILMLPFDSDWDNGSAAGWNLDYESERRRVIDYWRSKLDAQGVISGVDPHLDAFCRTVSYHVAVTADKDPQTKRIHCGAGTWYYWDFPNEACVQARWLDMIGDHEEAAAILQPMLDGQGSMVPPGAYSDPAGAFHRSGTYNMGAYGLDMGWTHMTLAEHYFLSRDTGWLAAVADNLAAAAEFVRRERRFDTMSLGYGLLPPGAIEDIQEWRVWYEINILAWAGVAMSARALADIDDPRAEELAELAAEYRNCIQLSMREATKRSCVVRLQDGTWIPHVPSHTESRHRDSGWIRECLESPIAKGMTVDFWKADDPLLRWLLADTEDNRYIPPTTDLGQDMEKWFSQCGITKQPMLVDVPIAYLKLGKPKHALRALINSYIATSYEDVHCLAEWIPEFSRGGGPFFKTPDECAWLAWYRSFFIFEREEVLVLGQGISSDWLKPGRCPAFSGMASYYGPLSARWDCVDGGAVFTLDGSPGLEGKDIEVWFRLPGVSGITVKEILGAESHQIVEGQPLIRLHNVESRVSITVKGV